MTINKNIYSCISVICPVNILGVSSMNIYHEYKIIHIYEEKMGEEVSQQVNHVVPSSNPIICNILLLHIIVYR